MKQTVWSEFLPWRCVEADLPWLKAHHLQLNLAIPAGSFPNPDLAQLLKSAHALEVPVGAWLLLSDRDGYWPNAENAAIFFQQALIFLDWLEKQALQVTELIIDLETPLALSRFIKGQLLQGLQLEWQRWFSERNHEQFHLAIEIFQNLVKTAHQAHLKIEAVTYPFVVHDAQANNTVFQEFLQIPVTPVPWDSVSLMVYRSSFQDFWPWQLSSWLVYYYMHTARQCIHPPVMAALGVIGSIGKLNESGFNQPDEMRKDLAAAKAAKAEGIELFSLDGMHQLGAPLNWLSLYSSSAIQPKATPGDTLLLHSLNQSHRLLSKLYTHFWAPSKSERLPSPLRAPTQNDHCPQKAFSDPDPSKH